MKTKNYIEGKTIWQWKVMEYILYIAIFIIPLYFSTNHWFPFSAPKAILISIFTFFILAVYSFGLFLQKREKFTLKITLIHFVLFIFLLILTLSSILGVDPHNSFFGVWSQSISLVIIYVLSILACLVGVLVEKNKSIIYKLFTASFISSVIFAVISYGGVALIPLSRGGGTLGNTSFAGAYLFFNFCFGVGLLLFYQKYWQKILIFIGIFAILFSPIFFNHQIFSGLISIRDALKNPMLFMGEANGAIIGVVVSLLIILCFLVIKNRRKWIKIFGLIAFLSILGGIFYAGVLFMNPNSSLHNTIIEQKTGNRFLFWDIANSGFTENPILGNGFNNYIYTFQSNFNNDFFKPGFVLENFTNQPHNMFWEYMSNTGILGTLSFFTLLVLVFIVFYVRNKNDNDREHVFKIVLATSLIGYFIQNMFVFDVPLIYFILFVIIGVAIGVSEKKKIILFFSKWYIYKIIGVILLIISIGGIIFLGFLPWKESREWCQIDSRKILKSGFNEISDIQKISVFGGVADAAFFVDKTFANYQKEIVEQVKISKNFEIINSAENILEEELKKQPLNFRARTTLVRVMIIRMTLSGKKIDRDLWDKAYTHVLKAQTINREHPDTYLLQANLQALIGDFEKMREIVFKGIAIAPYNSTGYITAKDLNKLRSDSRFMEYITEMEQKWIIE